MGSQLTPEATGGAPLAQSGSSYPLEHVDRPILEVVADGGPAEVDMCGEGVSRRGTFGWVFEPNICLAVPVRVVSVAVALNYGNTRMFSAADPSAVPRGRPPDPWTRRRRAWQLRSVAVVEVAVRARQGHASVVRPPGRIPRRRWAYTQA